MTCLVNNGIYQVRYQKRTDSIMDIAKLFKNGRSQAVRLPAAYRFDGDAVRVRRLGRAVILEPITTDPDVWFAKIDALAEGDFSIETREQPQTPAREIF